ncbi:RidA family protein [Pseudooceanicola nanhaiensis]|uniref:RidA family protein n=1 Tax=Pseudooceanicola nanhaiensis TaxID=375761 RepID=UPI001CD5E6DE|nr:RidA family protein [Pseudooceanicola nanhaiensis]MCA0921756.1 RidA family protein [Pseudooceanicola nanhaiensis]
MDPITYFPPPEGLPGVPPLVYATAHRGILYVSGLPGHDGQGGYPEDFAGQIRNVFNNLRAVLDRAGSTMADIIEVSVLLTDIGDVGEMNTIYREEFGDGPYPARITSAVVALPDPRMKIEIRCTARCPE